MRTKKKRQEMENPAPGPRGAFESDLLGSPVNSENSEKGVHTQDYLGYLLAECRGAVLRLRIQTNEVVTISLALKVGFISPDAAVEALRDLGVPFFLCGQPSDEGAE
jgi:hypothetical protein